MIPVSLRLKNFMSYGDEDNLLDFDSFHIACLTGSNGHGKSALLDAMTWALWGQARGIDGNGGGMDDLVRLGTEQMEVEFTFALEGTMFRVLRKRDKRRQASILEFQVQDGDTYRSLTGDRITETQSKILQVIKMDYDTFVNSAFILQGKADSFTQQKPNERKRILGEILGLAYYDQLESRAREVANEHEQQAKVFERDISSLQQEVQQLPTFEGELAKARETVSQYEDQVSRMKDTLIAVQTEKNRLDGLAAKKAEVQNSLQSSKEELLHLQQQTQRLQQQITIAQRVVAQEEDVTEGYQRLRVIQATLEKMNATQTKFLQLSQLVASTTQKIDKERHVLQVNLSKDEQVLKGIEEAECQLQELQEKRVELSEQVNLAQNLDAQIRELEGQVGSHEATLNISRGEKAAREHALTDLRGKYTELQQLEVCPYCMTDLTEEAAKHKVLQRVTVDGQQLKLEVQKLEEHLSSLEKMIHAEKDQLTKLKESYRELVPAGGQLKQIELQIGQLEHRVAGKGQVKVHVAQLQQLLTAFTDGVTVGQQELVKLEVQLGELNYDQTEHQEMSNSYQQLRHYEEKYYELQRVKQNLATLQESYQNLVKLAEATNAKIAINQEMLEQLTGALVDYPNILQQLQIIEKDLSLVQINLNKASEELGVWQARVAKAKESQAKCRELEQQLKVLVQEANYYRELAQAYGKKGIQAIIIENAIPELEQEANRLLTQMTDGRLSLALITQKGTKSGSLIETLDIQISDELGTRKYELFSGGEAFRVNFALRIALSKLLARRAGAKLQTLVIDEGFGTQDAQGMERLIEVINVIRDDFEKIIVITHINQLKEAFPVRIEVSKNATGSHFLIE